MKVIKVIKDEKLDVAYVKLRRGKIEKTVELRPGLLFDLDKKGDVAGIEVMSLEKLAPMLKSMKGIPFLFALPHVKFNWSTALITAELKFSLI
ncbi:MAG: DUF2283 domain-containing protein [Pseudobdellovibrionaceae bacterium]|nr:DUF2283 domain-containing protein [Bdellovibrionales bacterium]USN47298.1 MAG: DUF2283 domain-containing protein [Pseudobdellovibrionaceae bacterium]